MNPSTFNKEIKNFIDVNIFSWYRTRFSREISLTFLLNQVILSDQF